MRAAWVLCLTLLLLPARGQLSIAERQGLQQTLYLANLSEDDLKYARRDGADQYAMPLVNLSVDDPLAAADALMELHSRASSTLAAVLQAAATAAFGDAPVDGTVPRPMAVPAAVPVALRAPIGAMVACLVEANDTIRVALSKLTPSERRSIIESLPRWADPEEAPTFDFVHEPQLNQRRLLDLLQKVDLKAIRGAGIRLAAQVERLIPDLRAANADLPKTLTFQTHGLVVEVSGRGDDSHTARNTNLCIDLGGDNRYEGRYGAGAGYASVLVDLGKHSRFSGPDLNYGSGLLGVGLAYVLGDDSSFDCKSLCLGSGFAGVGGFAKSGGNDAYRAGALSEGAAAFGVGVMLDASGDDRYTARTGSQGYGRTQGIGWLIDQSGNDEYRVFRGQGCGEGFLTADGALSGGIGLLTDLGGADEYVGGVGCQGAGIGSALGSLLDQTGNDTYSAQDGAQGFARRTGAGYLFDLAGNDTYALHGAFGQATAIERSVAFLLDRSGDDLYTSLGSHPGSGYSGGLGILIDAAGDDRYQGRPGVGFPTGDKTSLGVFADLGGTNGYSAGLADEEAAVTPGIGVAHSALTPPDTIHITTFSDHKPPIPGVQPLPADSAIEALYRQAIAADKNFAGSDALIAVGQPALKWLIQHKLDSTEPGRDKPFLALLASLGAPGRTELAQSVDDPLDARAYAAMEILKQLKATELRAFLFAALKRPALQRIASDTIGQLGFKEFGPELLPLLASSDRLTVLSGLTALGTLQAVDGVGTAQVYLNTTDLPIREAAMRYMAEFPGPAIAAARARIGDSEERIARIGVELLGQVGTAESLEMVVPYLSHGSIGMKIQALLALNGRCPSDGRAAFLALRDDVNSLVRAVAARTDPGR